MEDPLLTAIVKAVRAYFSDASLSGTGFNILVPAHFASLKNHVATALDRGGIDDALDEELAIIVAMCALGPRQVVPPADIRADLLACVHRIVASGAARMEEIVISYGCGRWRTLAPEKGVWYDEWPVAIWSLGKSVHHAVNDANVWLWNRVPHFPREDFWYSPEGVEASRRAAAWLALSMVKPLLAHEVGPRQVVRILSSDYGAELYLDETQVLAVPMGAKLVFQVGASGIRCRGRAIGLVEGEVLTVLAREGGALVTFSSNKSRLGVPPGDEAQVLEADRLTVYACRCGNQQCDGRHRLAAWGEGGESAVSFWPYVASAVKGPREPMLRGSFVAGMYYPYLAEHGTGAFSENARLRQVYVEFKLCRNPDCGTSKPALYEGHECNSCGEPFDMSKTARKGLERLITVSDIAHYEPQARIRCRGGEDARGRTIACDNLHEQEHCPLCGLRPTKRRTTIVWVRTHNRAVSLDANLEVLDQYQGEQGRLAFYEPLDAMDTCADNEAFASFAGAQGESGNAPGREQE